MTVHEYLDLLSRVRNAARRTPGPNPAVVLRSDLFADVEAHFRASGREWGKRLDDLPCASSSALADDFEIRVDRPTVAGG